MFHKSVGSEIKDTAADAAAVAEDDAAVMGEQQRDVGPMDELDELRPAIAEKPTVRMQNNNSTAASIGEGNRNAKTSSLLWM